MAASWIFFGVVKSGSPKVRDRISLPSALSALARAPAAKVTLSSISKTRLDSFIGPPY